MHECAREQRGRMSTVLTYEDEFVSRILIADITLTFFIVDTIT